MGINPTSESSRSKRIGNGSVINASVNYLINDSLIFPISKNIDNMHSSVLGSISQPAAHRGEAWRGEASEEEECASRSPLLMLIQVVEELTL